MSKTIINVCSIDFSVKEELESISEYLVKLGLTKKEAEVYVALLASGPKTGMELSKLTSDPAPFVYRLLRRLEKKGLVFRISDNPMIFKAYPIDIVVSSLLDEREQEFKTLLSAKDTIIKLYELHIDRRKKSKELDFIVINGVTNTINVIGEMIERAECEIKNMVGIESVERIKYWHILEYEKAISRGVKVKILTSIDPSDVPDEIIEVSDIKFLKIPMNARFVIVDDKELIIITSQEEDGIMSIYSRNKSLVKTLSEVYDYIWGSI